MFSIKGTAIVVGLGLASASFACKTKESGPAPSTRTLTIQSSTSNDAADSATDAGKPALVDASWMERLELPGGRAAFVSVPLGTTTPRPIMVAAHGAGDRPEWACGAWRGITESHPFVVCPQGAPLGNGTFYWRSTEHLAETVELALAALRARFGSYVLEGPMVYAGFSAGAIYGAGLVMREPSRFPIVMMSEGGYDQLTDARFARAFARGRGQRVLFGCSTGGRCREKFRVAARLLGDAGIEARVNDAGNVGHNLNMEAVASLRRDWPWLVEKAVGWETSHTP